MKQYQPLSRQELYQEIHQELLEKIMKVLTSVHTAEIPWHIGQYRKQKQPAPQPFSKEEIQASADGWQTVLDEHKGVFGAAPLERIAEDINRILFWHNSEEPVLCHGDFHWDNLLRDDQGRILLCDWQGVEIGQASGDLSFFFGRLRGDGIELPERTVIEAYGEEVWRLSRKKVMWEEIDRHIRAANVITSFTCWYQYLYGSREERVREIYQKMVTDYESISISFT